MSLATTVSTLSEQYTVTGTVSGGEYRYYRFYDTDNTKGLGNI